MTETLINPNQINGGGSSGNVSVLNIIQDGSNAGNLIRNGAIVDGFSQYSYLKIGAMLDKGILSLTQNTYTKNFGEKLKTANSFEIVFLCNYKSKTATKQFFFGEKGSWASRIGIESGNVTIQLNFTGGQNSGSLITANGSYTFTEGADYYWKVTFDGSAYTLAIKGKNDDSYTTVATISDNTKFSTGREWIIGYVDTNDSNNEWGSYIDFSESYIKIDGEYWWKGVESL